jgi:hypothetical protein
MDLRSGMLYVDAGMHVGNSAVTIHTPYGAARDMGTQFELTAASGYGLRLRIREGAVQLERVDDETLLGQAGEELEISAEGVVQRRSFPRDHREWEWAVRLAPPPEIANQPVIGYFRWVARETGKALRFDTPATEARAATELWYGDPVGLTPLEILDTIVATTDFAYELPGDGTLLMRRK